MSLSSKQKQTVSKRAGDCCEYCLISQSGRLARFHVDHIIALKHGGTDDDDNLCLACPLCNAHKGENIAAADPETTQATFLFHPRRQVWDEHFRLNPDATISGLTPEGRATVAVLRINDTKRVNQRLGEMAVGDYPCKKD
ncbi:MAG: HNH endonuclease [Chloroflexi bacterium]|nr:MAG: HNH endonuclease [Chloroflexota bacterium]